MLSAVVVVTASAQDKNDKMMDKSDKMMMADDKRPVVVFVRADWCPYCKDLEPKMAKLVEQYGDKLRFVTLDITDQVATEKSAMIAKDAGVGEFFEMNKKKASTMAIFKDNKKIFTLYHSSNEKEVAAAFEKAAKE